MGHQDAIRILHAASHHMNQASGVVGMACRETLVTNPPAASCHVSWAGRGTTSG